MRSKQLVKPIKQIIREHKAPPVQNIIASHKADDCNQRRTFPYIYKNKHDFQQSRLIHIIDTFLSRGNINT